jgi:mRNA-degrading endonuclease HigB of HigAB toxin-antitoxin module
MLMAESWILIMPVPKEYKYIIWLKMKYQKCFITFQTAQKEYELKQLLHT